MNEKVLQVMQVIEEEEEEKTVTLYVSVFEIRGSFAESLHQRALL